MTTFEIESIDPLPAAVVRAEVPMDELTGVFDRAIPEVMHVVAEQGLALTGPPFGYYPRSPGATVEVAVGFPVSGPVVARGEVEPMELPGGRAVVGIHVGPFDSLASTYQDLLEWVAAEGLELAVGMWEVYLTDPSAEPDPSRWRTRIVWPLA